jgi:hypothetical protein
MKYGHGEKVDGYDPKVNEEGIPGYDDAMARNLALLAGIPEENLAGVIEDIRRHADGPRAGVGKIPSNPVWL